MLLKPQDGWREEVAIWILCLVSTLVISIPLIVKGTQEILAPAARQQGRVWPELALFNEVSNKIPGPSKPDLSQAYLDLDVLARNYSVGEVDNLRWSLVRRTPAAAEIYDQERGVNWPDLRRLSQTGTILLPAGFRWSFNETFQQGPGYKKAGSILAGGHCALATVFRAAAVQAGLPVESRPHAPPIPGFSSEESVNIFWGRDDLVVHNDSDQDLHFVWALTPDGVEIAVSPVAARHPLPSLPDWHGATVAMVYGRPGPGGWGSLGQTTIADHALHLARTYATRVDQWNGERLVVVAVNPNVVMAGQTTGRDRYLYYLIAEARRQGYYVMLDIQTGSQMPLPLFSGLMDKFLQENVWFDWDIEHTTGGKVEAQRINEVAAAYFERRRALGYESLGIFAFYVFDENQISNPSEVRRQYDGGVVIPIFDGFGGRSPNPAADKIARTARIISLFGEGPYGIMEFETRWGSRYDQLEAKEYFEACPGALIMASQ